MVKEKEKSHADVYGEFYKLWMDQSREFFETANKNLKTLFDKGSLADPEAHLKQINEWMATLKKQWEFTQLSGEQKAYTNYWKSMVNMCNEASDMMLKEWIKRSREQDPITNMRELYELWLNCCQDIYQKSLRSKSYQEAYAEFMNAAFKFWRSYTPNG